MRIKSNNNGLEENLREPLAALPRMQQDQESLDDSLDLNYDSSLIYHENPLIDGQNEYLSQLEELLSSQKYFDDSEELEDELFALKQMMTSLALSSFKGLYGAGAATKQQDSGSYQLELEYIVLRDDSNIQISYLGILATGLATNDQPETSSVSYKFLLVFYKGEQISAQKIGVCDSLAELISLEQAKENENGVFEESDAIVNESYSKGQRNTEMVLDKNKTIAGKKRNSKEYHKNISTNKESYNMVDYSQSGQQEMKESYFDQEKNNHKTVVKDNKNNFSPISEPAYKNKPAVYQTREKAQRKQQQNNLTKYKSHSLNKDPALKKDYNPIKNLNSYSNKLSQQKQENPVNYRIKKGSDLGYRKNIQKTGSNYNKLSRSYHNNITKQNDNLMKNNKRNHSPVKAYKSAERDSYIRQLSDQKAQAVDYHAIPKQNSLAERVSNDNGIRSNYGLKERQSLNKYMRPQNYAGFDAKNYSALRPSAFFGKEHLNSGMRQPKLSKNYAAKGLAKAK